MTRRILILFTFFAFFPGAIAAEGFVGKWFKIELVVFSHITPKGVNSEQWPQITPGNFMTNNFFQLNNASTTASADSNIVLLPNKDYILNNDVARLNKNPNYHVILHLAWKQKVLSAKNAVPIHIFGGQPDGAQAIANNTSLMKSQYANGAPWQVNGTVTISVKRYLTARFNLYFAAPASQIAALSNTNYFSNINQKNIYFHLLQSRRMRSKELNYIGHPLYGVLIKIMRDNSKETSE